METHGIHYDVGTATVDGTTTRPELAIEDIDREMADIASGLHANAVRVTGGDLDRIALAAEAAVRHGLEPWLSPMLPNADVATTLAAVDEAARVAERIRGRGSPCVLVVGCELSVFTAGILPGATHADRLTLLTDAARLVSEVTAAGIDPEAAFAAVLADAVARARSAFHGPITYASGLWETVDWSEFDIVGLDAYRDRATRDSFVGRLEAAGEHGRRVVVTETGCATYRGAADAGGMAWTALDRGAGGGAAAGAGAVRRLRAGVTRDEAEQARELGALLDIFDSAGIGGAFVYTYLAPSYPTSDDPGADLDAASYALVRSWPNGRTERKLAYHEVARRYGSQHRPAPDAPQIARPL